MPLKTRRETLARDGRLVSRCRAHIRQSTHIRQSHIQQSTRHIYDSQDQNLVLAFRLNIPWNVEVVPSWLGSGAASEEGHAALRRAVGGR